MQDRPAAGELLAAVRDFLQQEILPTLSDHRLKFRTLIAANVLTVVEREVQSEEAGMREALSHIRALDPSTPEAELTGLAESRAALAEGMRALCMRIRAGEADSGAWGDAVHAFARWSVEEKLRVSNPRYLATLQEEAGG